MNAFGLVAGLITLLIIGLGFPLVILGERKLGFLWWPYMLAFGFFLVILSIFIQFDWISVIVGVLGATFVWGSTELKEQAIRTELGWFRFDPDKIRPPFEGIIRKWRAPHL